MRMAHRRLMSLLLICLGFAGPIEAAAFGAGSSLINAPDIVKYKPGKVDIGVLTGVTSGQQYQFDFKFGYAVTEYLNVGLVFLRANTVVANFQATMIDIPDYSKLKIGFGILNISSDPSLSTWEDEKSTNSNHLFHYLGLSADVFGGEVLMGVCKRRTGQATGGASSFLNSTFFGLTVPTPLGNVMAESDGTDVSVGYKATVDGTEWKLGVSTPRVKESPGSLASHSFFSIQFQRSFDIFESYTREFLKLKKSNDDYETIKKESIQLRRSIEKELTELRASKEALNSEISKLATGPNTASEPAKKPQQISSDYSKDAESFHHYQKAQQYYLNHQPYQALRELEKAVELLPQQPVYFIQMGSIYFSVGDRDAAIKYWAKAYKLGPENLELNRLPRDIFEQVKQKSSQY